MTIFLFIRHGEADHITKGILAGSTPGIHLTQHGIKQAEILGQLLKNISIKDIYSSPLERAIETAEPLAKEIGRKILIHPGLRETDVGKWTGKKIKLLQNKTAWKHIQENPSRFTFPGGDSFSLQQTKLVKVIDDISPAYGSKDVVAVFTHADPIKLVISFYLGMPLDNFQRISIDLASISIIFINGNECRVATINYQCINFEQKLLSFAHNEAQ